MNAGHQVLAGILNPLHRTPQPHRQQTDRHLFREQVGLDPEAAANKVGRSLVSTKSGSSKASDGRRWSR
jgi:hypothetical protein